jgi:lipoyl(octanoyl) transferase
LKYETFVVERGGQATYHGPGQLVLYPILDLSFFEKDINAYLRGLEQVVINTAAEFEILADRVDGLTGVWVGDKKISAIG